MVVRGSAPTTAHQLDQCGECSDGEFAQPRHRCCQGFRVWWSRERGVSSIVVLLDGVLDDVGVDANGQKVSEPFLAKVCWK